MTINGLTESHPNVVVDVAYDCRKEQLNVAPCGRVHCEPRGRFGGCRCDHYDEADVYMATCTEDWGVNVGGDVTTTSSSSSVQTLTPAPSYSTTVQPAPTPTQMATTRLIISENTSGTLDTTSGATQSLTPSSIARSFRFFFLRFFLFFFNKTNKKPQHHHSMIVFVVDMVI